VGVKGVVYVGVKEHSDFKGDREVVGGEVEQFAQGYACGDRGEMVPGELRAYAVPTLGVTKIEKARGV